MKQSNSSNTRRKISHSELWAWAEETLNRQQVTTIGVASTRSVAAQKSIDIFSEALLNEGWLKFAYDNTQSTRLEAWLSDRLLEYEHQFHIPQHVELESHHHSELKHDHMKQGQIISSLLNQDQKASEGSEWAGFKFELPDDWSVIDDSMMLDESISGANKEVKQNLKEEENKDYLQHNSCVDVLRKVSKHKPIVLLFTASRLGNRNNDQQVVDSLDLKFLEELVHQLQNNRKDSPLLLIWLNPSFELDDTVHLKVEHIRHQNKFEEEKKDIPAIVEPKSNNTSQVETQLDDSEQIEINFDRIFQETFNAQAEVAPVERYLDQSIHFDEFTDDPLIQISLGHVAVTVLPKAGSEEFSEQQAIKLSVQNESKLRSTDQLKLKQADVKLHEKFNNGRVDQDHNKALSDSPQDREMVEIDQSPEPSDTQYISQETDYTTTELPALSTSPNFISLDRAQFSQCAQLAQEYFGPQALFLSAASICGPTCSMGQVTAVWKGIVDRPLDEINSFNELLWESLSSALTEGLLKETHHQRFMNEPSFRFNQPKLSKFWRRRLETLLSTRLIRRAFRNLANWMTLQSINPVARPQVTLSVIDLWIEAGEMTQASHSSLHVAKLFLERGDGLKAKKALQKTIQLLGPDGHWQTWRECYELLLKLTIEAGDELAIEMTCKQFIERAWRVGDSSLTRKLTQLLEKLYKKAERYQDAEYLGEWSASQPFVDQATALFDAPLTMYPEALVEEVIHTQQGELQQDSPISIAPSTLPEASSDHQLNSQNQKEANLMSLPDIHTLEAPPAYLLEALITLRDRGYEAYVVGGSVRDRLLEREVNDWDLTTNALPTEVIECFDKVIETGIEHGTVTVVLGQEHIEITTYRIDGDYIDGRHPEEVSFTRSLEEDLLRRDFTVNAIAWDPIDAQIRDPYQGGQDISARCIRAVGSPIDRFQEDGLRVLRAIRFATVLDFSIDPETQNGAISALDTLKQVAVERVQVELFKTLLAPQAGRGLQLIRDFGVEEVCFPHQALVSDATWSRIVSALNICSGDLACRLALVLHGIQSELQLSQVQFAKQAQATFKSLKFSNKLSQQGLKLLAFSTLDPKLERQAAQLRALAVDIGIDHLDCLWAYQQAWSSTEPDIKHGSELLQAWQQLEMSMIDLDVVNTPKAPKDLKLNGHELCKALDIFPSRVVGDILNELLRWVWADLQRNTKQSLVEQARVIATERGII